MVSREAIEKRERDYEKSKAEKVGAAVPDDATWVNLSFHK